CSRPPRSSPSSLTCLPPRRQDRGVTWLISRRALLQAFAAQALSAVRVFGQARVLRKPKPLAAGAVTSDWASFLGPSHNAVSRETRLSRVLPPPLVWEFPKIG